ncbi:MAG: hypothetical protein Q9160_000146 [Pyrenula sp. 1 TL-2023]
MPPRVFPKTFADITYADLKNGAVYQFLKPHLAGILSSSRSRWVKCKLIAEELSMEYAMTQMSTDPDERAEADETKHALTEARTMEQILKGKFETEQRMVEEFNAFGMFRERALEELSDYDDMVVRAEGCWVDFETARGQWWEWRTKERNADEAIRKASR